MAVDDIVLTLFSRSDYAVVKSWFENQAQLTQWGGPAVRHPLDDSQLDGMLSMDPVRLSWMARQGDKVIGHAQAFSIDSETGIARLGRIVVAPAHRGQGLAVPMLRRVLDQLFATAGVERVDLGVYTWNVGARQTYLRLGFLPGEIRIASVQIEDQAWDLQEMSLTRGAFLAAHRWSRFRPDAS